MKIGKVRTKIKSLTDGALGQRGHPHGQGRERRSEEYTSELQSHSFISYAVFFFNDTATTEIYTLPLHDALPICKVRTKIKSLTDGALGQRGHPHGQGRERCPHRAASGGIQMRAMDSPRINSHLKNVLLSRNVRM